MDDYVRLTPLCPLCGSDNVTRTEVEVRSWVVEGYRHRENGHLYVELVDTAGDGYSGRVSEYQEDMLRWIGVETTPEIADKLEKDYQCWSCHKEFEMPNFEPVHD